MKNMSRAECENFRAIQATLTSFRRNHTSDLTLDDIRIIADAVGDVNLLLKRYSDALPGGI